MSRDPRGPYGEVLRLAPRPAAAVPDLWTDEDHTAYLIIDPQRSFTAGVWMRSLGPGGQQEIIPILRAFQKCAELLRRLPPSTPSLFTRCPFPPESYDWDDLVVPFIATDQPYFIKPGNSALWPETNGLGDHLQALMDGGVKTLVLGGCTLNSCVRVSAMELQRQFGSKGLQVVVDLALCGARASNYLPSTTFSGLSSVDSAIQQMQAAGVKMIGAADRIDGLAGGEGRDRGSGDGG